MLIEICREYARAARILRKSPGFVSSVAITLAIVISANGIIFGVLDALMIRAFSIPEPERLVQIVSRSDLPGMPDPFPWSYPDYQDVASATSELFSGTSLYKPSGYLMEKGGYSYKISGAEVSGDFFSVVGLGAEVGRPLTSQDNSEDRPNFVAVISKRFWNKQFGSNPAILGESINLNGYPFTVIGIVDGGDIFRALREPDVLVPIQAASQAFDGNPLNSRGAYWIQKILARLESGVSIGEARAAVELQAKLLAEAHPEFREKELHLSVEPSHTYSDLKRNDRSAQNRLVLVIWAATWLLILAGIFNVANLNLTRQLLYKHELSIQAALGATPQRLVGGMLAETSIIVAIGSIAAGFLAWLGSNFILPSFGFSGVRATFEIHSFLNLVVVATLVSLGAALIPVAAISFKSLASQVGANSPKSSFKAKRTSHPLLICQIAAAVFLLIGVGLIARSISELERVDIGFDSADLIAINLDFTQATGSKFSQPSVGLVEKIREEVLSLPNVHGISFTNQTPFDKVSYRASIDVLGSNTESSVVSASTVSVEFFDILGVSVLSGMSFSEISSNKSNGVLINQIMAESFWPEGSSVGGEFVVGDETFEVVGVVADFRDVNPAEPAQPSFFRRYPNGMTSSAQMLVKVLDGGEAETVSQLDETLNRIAPSVGVYGAVTIDERLTGFLHTRYNLIATLGFFAFLAVLISFTGVYSVVAYQTVMERYENGVRMALGATFGDIFNQLLKSSLRLSVGGILLGVLASLVLNRFISSFIYNVSLVDLKVYVSTVVLVLLLIAVAGTLPALRALKLSPSEVINR